jgi:hypothetical protein
MTVTRAIGIFFGGIINAIVSALALSRVHPNVLTFIGLLINIWAAFLFAAGKFRWAGVVVIGAGLFAAASRRWPPSRPRPRSASAYSFAARYVRKSPQAEHALAEDEKIPLLQARL